MNHRLLIIQYCTLFITRFIDDGWNQMDFKNNVMHLTCLYKNLVTNENFRHRIILNPGLLSAESDCCH